MVCKGDRTPLSNSGTDANLGALQCFRRTDETLRDSGSLERHLPFERPTGPITTQSAYGGKFSTCCFLPQHSPGNGLRSPPALRTIKKDPSRSRENFGRRLGGMKSPLNLPKLKNLFADRAELQPLSQREESHHPACKWKKGGSPFECARILVPDFLMFHDEQIPARSVFHL
jgi:hypothetical protein